MSFKATSSLALAVLLFASPAFAGWAVQTGAVGGEKATDSQLEIAILTTIQVGWVNICQMATDNAAGGDAGDPASNEHTSVTDDGGNLYTKIGEQRNGEGNQNQGVTVSTWWADIETQLTGSTDSVYMNLSSSRTAKAGLCQPFSVSQTGTTVTREGVDRASTDGVPASLSISGLSSQEYLWIRVEGKEDADLDLYTADADYTNISIPICTTGGGADSNICLTFDWRIYTGTGDTNLPLDGESDTWAELFLALKEAEAAEPSARRVIIIN